MMTEDVEINSTLEGVFVDLQGSIVVIRESHLGELKEIVWPKDC